MTALEKRKNSFLQPKQKIVTTLKLLILRHMFIKTFLHFSASIVYSGSYEPSFFYSFCKHLFQHGAEWFATIIQYDLIWRATIHRNDVCHSKIIP